MMKDAKIDLIYHLYEIYTDQAASDAHLETEHFKKVWVLKNAGKFTVEEMTNCVPIEITES